MKRLVVPCGNQISLLSQQLAKKYPGLPEELTDLVIKDPLVTQLLDKANDYLDGIIDGLDISDLHKGEYHESFNIYAKDSDIMIEFHGESWVIEALENGHSGYDIKAALLNSSKARISKAGDRYRHIPMKKDITSHPALKIKNGDSASLETIRGVVQKRFRGLIGSIPTPEASLLQSDKYEYKSDYFTLAAREGGGKAITIERVRTFRKNEKIAEQEKFVSWITVSEKNGTGMEHPGFIAVNAADHLQTYLFIQADMIKRVIESIIQEQL